MAATRIYPAYLWGFDDAPGVIVPGDANIPSELTGYKGNDPASSVGACFVQPFGKINTWLQITDPIPNSSKALIFPNPAKRIFAPVLNFGFCLDLFFRIDNPSAAASVAIFADATLGEFMFGVNLSANGIQVGASDSPGGGWVYDTGWITIPLIVSAWRHCRICMERSPEPYVAIYVDGVQVFLGQAAALANLPIVFTGESTSPADSRYVLYLGESTHGPADPPPYDVGFDALAILDTFDPGDGAGNIVIPIEVGGVEVFRTYEEFPFNYQANSVKPIYLWPFDDEPPGDFLPSSDPDYPAEDGTADANGNFFASNAGFTTDAPKFGTRSLRLNPVGSAYSVRLPYIRDGIHTKLRPDYFTTIDGLSFDAFVRFSETTPDDPTLALKVWFSATAVGAGLFGFEVQRDGVECWFQRGGAYFTARSQFGEILAKDVWHNVRFGVHNGPRGIMTFHVDGARKLYFEDGGGLPTIFGGTGDGMIFMRCAGGAGRYACVDRLALLPDFQFHDYVPAADEDIFTFFEGFLPYAQIDPQLLTFVLGEVVNVSILGEGGTPPYSFVVTEGILPPKLQLSEDGNLTGTAVGLGEFTAKLKIIDALGYVGENDVRFLVVKEAYIKHQFTGPLGYIASADPAVPPDATGHLPGNSFVSAGVAQEASIVASTLGHANSGGAMRIFNNN